MLIITGTQRSGTSAVAKLFLEEGHDLGGGETFWDEEARGGYDNPRICKFYQIMLGDENFPFDDYPYKKGPFTLKDDVSVTWSFTTLDVPVVKFCYLCMSPVFVYLWAKYRPPAHYDDRFLVMERPADEVVRSKKEVFQRFVHDSILLKQTTWQLKANCRSSLLAMQRLGMSHSVVSFEEVMYNFCINDYLRALGYEEDELHITEETWKKVIKRDMIHRG